VRPPRRHGTRGHRARPRDAGFALLLASCCALAPLPARAACTVQHLADLPVTMMDMQPVVHAAINGQDVRLIADTGAFYSMLAPSAATQLHLPLEHVWNVVLSGVGGDTQLWQTHVKSFGLLEVKFSDVVFLVGGNDFGNGIAGLLGENLFRQHDVEYDLANGMIRLFRPKDCKDVNFAYWARASGQAVSALVLEASQTSNPRIIADAYVNGTRISAMFDTGAFASVLAMGAARRAGITPDTPGVTPAGNAAGVGRHAVRTWIAPVSSFKLGDEEIRNTRLRIGEVMADSQSGEMLLGADFFLSHRVFVSNSERRIFFTYNGGPVFNLTPRAAPPPDAAAQPGAGGATTASAPAAPDTRPGEPTDAAGYARRGSAFAARRDYAAAIADLSRACELAPSESTYFYQRALAYLGNGQPDPALADFDQAIKLKPDDVEALIGRARLHLERHDPRAAVIADLDAADRAASSAADSRMALGDLYQRAGDYQAAVVQYSQWLDAHRLGDLGNSRALTARCWSAAMSGQELDRALDQCNAAVKGGERAAAARDGRGYVYLRRGDYDRAIADFDAALHAEPRRGSALYGRGIARLRAGKSDGQADLDSARQIDPGMAQRMAALGIRTP
jgi:tetratricopeptide (TPR) repeat protein/predicted aspartyl protease